MFINHLLNGMILQVPTILTRWKAAKYRSNPFIGSKGSTWKFRSAHLGLTFLRTPWCLKGAIWSGGSIKSLHDMLPAGNLQAHLSRCLLVQKLHVWLVYLPDPWSQSFFSNLLHFLICWASLCTGVGLGGPATALATKVNALPRKLTWNLKIKPLKRNIIFQTLNFGFPVGFFGGVLLLMKEILHQLIWRIFHFS